MAAILQADYNPIRSGSSAMGGADNSKFLASSIDIARRGLKIARETDDKNEGWRVASNVFSAVGHAANLAQAATQIIGAVEQKNVAKATPVRARTQSEALAKIQAGEEAGYIETDTDPNSKTFGMQVYTKKGIEAGFADEDSLGQYVFDAGPIKTVYDDAENEIKSIGSIFGLDGAGSTKSIQALTTDKYEMSKAAMLQGISNTFKQADAASNANLAAIIKGEASQALSDGLTLEEGRAAFDNDKIFERLADIYPNYSNDELIAKKAQAVQQYEADYNKELADRQKQNHEQVNASVTDLEKRFNSNLTAANYRALKPEIEGLLKSNIEGIKNRELDATQVQNENNDLNSMLVRGNALEKAEADARKRGDKAPDQDHVIDDIVTNWELSKIDGYEAIGILTNIRNADGASLHTKTEADKAISTVLSGRKPENAVPINVGLAKLQTLIDGTKDKENKAKYQAALEEYKKAAYQNSTQGYGGKETETFTNNFINNVVRQDIDDVLSGKIKDINSYMQYMDAAHGQGGEGFLRSTVNDKGIPTGSPVTMYGKNVNEQLLAVTQENFAKQGVEVNGMRWLRENELKENGINDVTGIPVGKTRDGRIVSYKDGVPVELTENKEWKEITDVERPTKAQYDRTVKQKEKEIKMYQAYYNNDRNKPKGTEEFIRENGKKTGSEISALIKELNDYKANKPIK